MASTIYNAPMRTMQRTALLLSLLNPHYEIRLFPRNEIKTKRGAMRARVALARKLLSISWYMVKKDEPYQQRFTAEKKTA